MHMCDFDEVRRGNYFGGEPIKRTDFEVRVGMLKNGKAAGKDDFTVEIIKGGSDMVVDWIWRLCNMTFERNVRESWMTAVIVPLYKGKGERTECRNYRGISLLNVVGKIHAGVLVEKSP